MDQDKEQLLHEGQSHVPPPYPEQPPPYVAPPPSFPAAQPSNYGAPHPPPQVQPGYAPPPPPQVQPGYAPAMMQQSNVTVMTSQPVCTPALYVQIKPSNYIILSVIAMVFFCWVFGLIALLFAVQVDSSWHAGDREGARRQAAAARGWSVAGIVFGIVAYVAITVGVIVRVAVITNDDY